MSVFSRRPRSILPSNIVPMMERFGRNEIDIYNPPEDAFLVFQQTQQPLIEVATSRTADFIRELADACVPSSGWAAYGADRTVINLVSASPPGTDWLRILDASISFLRANYVPPMRIPPYAWARFIETGGTSNTWIPLRPVPARGEVSLRPVVDGEERPLVRLGPDPDANIVLVVRDGREYVALVDSRTSDSDPTRTRREWKRATDQHELYADVAWSSQIWDWADPELEPYFPAPRPLI